MKPGWSAERLSHGWLGRNHRAPGGRERLRTAIERTRALLRLPDDYLLGIVPASDTGAVELAMWSLLGPRPVQLLSFEVFGRIWVRDARELGLRAEALEAPFGRLPDLGRVRPDHDLVFPWNGTTSGVRVPDAQFISAEREGVVICDATSAIFAQSLDWPKLDAVAFSWQKALGGEAAHGMLALSPRAVERIEAYDPPWPLPKLFRLKQNGRLDRNLFDGATINTPSMLCVEDWQACLDWAEACGGPGALRGRADGNAAALARWVERTEWVAFLAEEPVTRSNTSVCLKLTNPAFTVLPEDEQRRLVSAMARMLELERAAYDIEAHRSAPPGLRVWCGPTVETADVEALGPWLDWAYAETLAGHFNRRPTAARSAIRGIHAES